MLKILYYYKNDMVDSRADISSEQLKHIILVLNIEF